jgi:hypothetical protein
MCARFAFTIIAFVASATVANAADVRTSPGGYVGYSDYGLRTEPVIVYDYEPEVIVRTYWEPPWRNHHYFPSTGRRPKVASSTYRPVAFRRTKTTTVTGRLLRSFFRSSCPNIASKIAEAWNDRPLRCRANVGS